MSFLIKDHWRKLNRTVWTALGKKKSAPPDMYIALLQVAKGKQGIADRKDIERSLSNAQLSKEEYLELSNKLKLIDEALNDPERARAEFFRLPVPDSERRCIEILEGSFDVLRDSGRPTAGQYRDELRKFVREHNLRYEVTDRCKLILSIPGVLMSQYSKFRSNLAANPHLFQPLEELEESVSKLESTSREERSCIRVATNMLEGIACAVTTNGEDTLSAAIEGCKVFPHAALMECVRKFYKFASDYPNIRHAGNPASKLRELKKDDALLSIALAVAFGNYVFANDASVEILRGEL